MDIQKRINRQVREELARCQFLYKKLQNELQYLEKGSIAERNGTFSWYIRKDGKQSCRKIEDGGLLRRLKKRQYIKRGLPILRRRIENCTNYLEHDVVYDPVSIGEKMPSQYKGLKNIDVFLQGDINIDNWVDEEYKRGTMYKDGQIYRIDNETWLRSKSETMISMRLKENFFSIRYEPEVKLGNKTVYPDFEILLPNCRRIVYHEHLGMMDDPAYAMRALQKIQDYAAHGIYLGYNLVITYETRERPLTLVDIDKLIEQLKEMDRG